MRIRTFISFISALLLGATVAVVIKVGFALPGVLSTSDIFMFVLDSPLGNFALAKRGGEGGVLIAIAIRAFTYSVMAGAIAGAVLGKFGFKRVFCYSALWVPIGNIALGYIALSAVSVSDPEKVVALQKNLGQLVWTDLWVYGMPFHTIPLK